ncbi:cGMP-dependent 3 5-cyclic phosphodiesterase, partial [Biomphalaria pfeifferi]
MFLTDLLVTASVPPVVSDMFFTDLLVTASVPPVVSDMFFADLLVTASVPPVVSDMFFTDLLVTASVPPVVSDMFFADLLVTASVPPVVSDMFFTDLIVTASVPPVVSDMFFADLLVTASVPHVVSDMFFADLLVTASVPPVVSDMFFADVLVTASVPPLEALMPVLDATNLTELREAIKLTISRCVLNTQLIKVFLRDPLTSHLVDEHCRPLPNSRFISDILHQKGKTVVSVNHNQDSIRELLGSQHSNDNNHSVLLLPIPERGTHRSIGLIVVVSQAGSLSSVDPKRVELCLKQISVTYEVVKNNLTKENAPPHISNLLSLIQLCGELNDPDAAKLEIKVVRYLQRHTDAESGFLLLVVPETQMLFCQAVGDTVLQEEVRFAGPSSCFAKALETKQPITLADIPVERRHEVEKIIRRQINTLLCVPVCVSDSKDLLALACMVNKSNNEQFTQQDIDTILQCFKYTATVLTSTLAFQNERKLKNQTQALLLVARKLFTRLDANLSQSWDETANLNKVSSVEPDSGHSAGLSGSPRLIRCQGLGPTSSHCSEPGCIAQLINSLPTNQAQNTLIVLPLSAFRGSDQSSTVCRPESCLVERAHSTVRHRRSDSESSSEYSTASSSAPSSNQPLHNNNPNKKPSLDMKNDKSTDPTICGEHNVFDHRSITDSSTCFYFKQIDDLARDVGLRLRDQHEDMTLKELEFNRYFFNNLEQFQELLSAVNSDNINYASPESCISPVLNTSPLANLSSMTSMSADIMKDYFQCEDNVHLPDKQIHIDNYTQCESCKLKPDIRSRTFRKFKSPDQTFFGQKQSVKSALQSKRSNSISLQRSNIKMLSHTSLPPEKGSHCSTRIKNTLSKQCRSLSNNRNMVNRSSPKVDAGYCKKNRKPLCRLCRSVSNSRSRGVSLSPLERKKTSTVVEVSTDSVYQVVKPSAQCGIEDVSDEASFHSLSDEDTDLDNTDTSIQRLLTSIQDSSRNDLQCSLVLKVKKCSTEEKSDLFQLDSDLGLQNTNDKSVAEVQVGQKDKDSLCTLGVGKSCHSNKQGFALLAENFTTDELVTYPDPCRTTQSSPLNQQASVAQLTGEGDDELVTYHDPCTHSSPLTEQASVAQLTGEGDHLTSAVDRHIELCSFNLAFGDSFEPVGCLGKDPVLPVNTKLDSREQILKVEDIVVVQNEETQFIQGSNNNDNNCDYFQDAFDCFQETKMDYSHCMKYIETDHFQSDLIACEHVESAHVVSVVRKTDEVSIKIHFENDLRHRALRFHNNEFISDGELDYKDQLKNDEDANCVTGINAENFTCASRVLKSETNVKTHHLAYHLEQGVDSFAPRDVIPSAIDLKHVSSDSEPQFVEELSILWEGSLLSQQDEESMSVTADVKDLESLNGSEESNLNLDLDMCSVYLEETNYEDVASSHVIRVPGDLQQTEPIVTSSIKTDTWEINSLIREYKKRFLEDNISLPFVKTQCCAELAFKKSDATTEIEYDPSLKTETEENKDLSLRSHFLNINTDNVSTCKQTDIRAEKPIKSGVIWSQEINTEVEHCLVPDNIQMFSMNSDLTLHQDLSVEQTTGFIFDQECPNLAANVVNLDSLDNIAVDDDFIFYPDMFSYEIHLKDDSDSLSSDMSLKEDSRNVHISVSSQDYSQQEESDQQVNEESNQEVYEESNQEVYEESDQQVNEDSNQEVYEESDQQVNEESNQEVYEESDQVNEESDQEVNEESYQEVNEESYQEVNEESYQEVNEESYQEVNEESDQQVNEEFFDQQVNEESDQEVNEESDQEVNEESDQEVNEESDQEVNEESDQEVNEESDQQINEESDQEVNEEFLDQQVNEEFDQEVKEKSDQEINEEFDQQVNEKFDQQVNEESDQQINEESDQEVNEEFLDQQVNEEFDQEVNEESYQEVNEESYQEVNEESYQEVNEESDQQVNEESDQEVNEEFLDQQVNEEFDQEVKEKSDQEINEESDQEVNEESDQEVNEESDQEVNEESDQQVNEEFFDQEVNEEFFDQEVNEEFDQQVNEESNQEVYEESDQQVNEESNQEVYEESDQQVNEESNQEVYEESDQQVNEESNQEVYEESDQQVNEESNQEVNEESYQEVNEESDQQVNEEFFDQQVNEESVQEVNEEADQEVNEESYQEVNEESDQEVNEKSDQEINEEFDQQVNEKFDQQVNEESDQEVNEEFLDQQVNEEFDQEVKEKSDQEINEESDQEVNEESDQEVNEESDQQVNEEFFDQEVNEEFDQQVNEEFDQQVNEKFDQQVNEESDQEVNEESDQQVNEETDPQDNEESDHQDNEESDQEVNEESDQQVNEETDPQDNEESDHQDNEESDQQDNEESDQEVNDNIEFNKESDQVNDEIEINKVFDHECYDFSDEFKKINDESDQDVNDEMDFKDQLCQFNDEIDFNEDFGQQVNDEIEFSEESDQKVNEEFDQEVTYETDFNKEFDQQLVNERDFKPHHHEKDLNIESNQEVETKLDVQQECSLQIIFTTDFSQKLNLEINGEICSLKKSNQQNVVAINAMRITEQIKLNEESSQILDDINFNADAIEIQKDIDLNAESSQIQKDIDFKADSSVVLDEIDYIEEACYLVPVKNHLTRELNLQSQENKDLVRKFYQVLDKTSYINESNQKIPEEKDATEKYFHQESIHQSHENKYFNEESSHENHEDKDMHEEAIQCNLDEAYFKEESSQQSHNVKDFDDESTHYIQDVKLSQQIHDEIYFKIQYIHDEIGFNEEASQQSHDDFNEKAAEQSHYDFNEEPAQPIYDDDLSLQIQEKKDICMKSSEQIYYKEDYIADSGQQSHDETDLKEELHPKNQNKINLFQKLNPQIINKIASCDTLNFPMNDEIDFTYESTQHKSYESGITQKYVESLSEDQQIITALDSNEESREPMCPDLDWNKQCTPSSDTLTLIQETIEQVITEGNVHSQTIPSLPNKTNALFIQDTQGIIKELGLIKLRQPMAEKTTEGEEHHIITAINLKNDKLNEEHNKCNETNDITADNQQIILYKIESKKMNEQVLEEDICTEISDQDILKVSCNETSSHYTEVFIEAFSQLIHDEIVEVSSQQSDHDVSKQQSDNEIDLEDVIVSSLGQINGPLINILHLEALSDVCEYDNDVVGLDSTQCLPTDLEIKYDEGSISFLLETADELEKTELLSYPTRVQDTTFHYEMGGQMYEIEEEKLYQLAQEILGESPEQEEILLEKMADLNYCCLDYASQEPVVRRQDVYLTKDLFLADSSKEVIFHTDSVIETKCGSSFDHANIHLKWADRSNRESDLHCEAHLLPEHYVKLAHCATSYHLPDTDKENFEPFETSTDLSIDEVTGLKHVSLGTVADALSPKRPLTISYSDHDIAIGFFNSQSFPLLDDQSMSLPDISICSHFDWSQNSNRPMTRFSDATDMRSWSSVPSVHKKMSPFDSQLRKTKSDQNLKLLSPRYSWSPSTQNSFYVHPKPWDEHQQANDLSPLCLSSSGTLNTSSSSLGQNISATAQRILKEDEEIRSDPSTKRNIAAGYSRHLKDSFTYGEFSRDLSHLKNKYQSGFKSMPRNDMEDLSLKTESNTKRVVKAIRNNLHSSYARSSDILKTLYEPETTSFKDPNSQPDFKSNWKSSGDNEREAFRYHYKKITDDFSELDHVYTCNNLEHGQGFNEHSGQLVGCSSQSCLVGQESEHMSTSRKRYINDYSYRTWNESDLNLTADDTDFLGDFKKPLPFDHTKYYKNKIHGSNTYMTFSCPKDETYGRLIFHQHNHGDESQIPSHSHFQSSFMDYLNADSRQHRVSFLNEKTNFDLSTESGLDSSMTDSLFDGILDKGSDDSFECHFLSSKFAGARRKENNNHYDESILESSLAEEVSSRDDMEDTFNECMLMNNKEMEDHGFVTPAFTNRGINAILAEDTSEGSDSGESDPMENNVYPNTDAPNVCLRKTLANQTGQKDVKESDVKRGYVDRENQDPLTLGHLDCNLAGGPLNLNINVVLQ